MSIAEFLATVDGFQHLERAHLEDLATQVREDAFAPGTQMMRAGESGDHMLVLREGAVEVGIPGPDGREKMRIALGPGDLVGEMALLSGEPRTADVRAVDAVRAVRIDRDLLAPLLEEHPPLAGFLTQILGKRLDEGGIDRVDRYRLLGLIAEGTTGRVYEAIHPGLGRVVAVKMLFHSLVYRARFRERFQHEARLLAGMSHPNIVQVFDTGRAYGTHWIAMEKLAGSDLSHLLKARSRIEPSACAAILRQVGAALHYAHDKGIAHRDVKPQNVAIDDRGHVKLMDFGIAMSFVSDSGDEKKSVDGTPQYIAPETAMGQGGDGRVDVYALGVMAFQMLTGRLPFEKSTIRDMLRAHVLEAPPDLRAMCPEAPEGLLRFVEGALVKDPEARLGDWTAIQRLLDVDAGRAAAGQMEEVLRLRYDPADAERVAQALAELSEALGPEVDLARARLVSSEDS